MLDAHTLFRKTDNYCNTYELYYSFTHCSLAFTQNVITSDIILDDFLSMQTQRKWRLQRTSEKKLQIRRAFFGEGLLDQTHSETRNFVHVTCMSYTCMLTSMHSYSPNSMSSTKRIRVHTILATNDYNGHM